MLRLGGKPVNRLTYDEVNELNALLDKYNVKGARIFREDGSAYQDS